jgi:hypothetical protein
MGSLTPGNGTASQFTGADAQAYQWSLAKSPPFSVDECLLMVREAFGLSGGEATAQSAWTAAQKDKATYSYDASNPPPANVPIFWSGPNSAGHVALSAGGGMAFSTDIGGDGTVSLVPISSISSWLGQQPEGWSSELEGVSVSSATGATSTSSGSSGGFLSDLGNAVSDLNPLNAVNSAVSTGVDFLKSTAERVAFFIGGMILLIFVLFKAGG